LTCPAWLMGFFAPAEAGDFVRIGAILLALSAAWQLFDSAGMALSEILRSAGDTTFSLVARILVAWIVFVPLSYLFVTVYDGGASACRAERAGGAPRRATGATGGCVRPALGRCL